jgi:hypothetical protein
VHEFNAKFTCRLRGAQEDAAKERAWVARAIAFSVRHQGKASHARQLAILDKQLGIS